MNVFNNVTKSWLELEASALEAYKYSVEGTGRTVGSNMLTHTKSLITLAEKDPEAFKVTSTIFVGTLLAAAAIGSAGTAVYFTVKNRKAKNIEIEEKEND